MKKQWTAKPGGRAHERQRRFLSLLQGGKPESYALEAVGVSKATLSKWRQDPSFKIEHNKVRRGSRPDYGRSRTYERTDREIDVLAADLVSLMADGRDEEFVDKAADVATDPYESVLLMSRLATAASWFAGVWAGEDVFDDMLEFWRIEIERAHDAGEVTDKHRGALAAVES